MTDECLTLSVPEAAKLIGTSRAQLYAVVKAGKPPPGIVVIKLGRSVRIARRPLLAYLGAA